MLFGFGDVVASMAPSPRRSSGKDANALPSASSTFWAIMILVGLLIAYCSQLAAGTCEIVTLDRDSSQPRRTIARQTARCACKKGQIAGTTRARPACVDESTKVVSSNPSCSIRLDLFQSLMPEDVDKLLGAMQPTTCSLYPCLTWLLLSNREIFGGGLANIINSLLWEGRMPPCLKEAMIRPILKKPFLDSSVIVSYRPVSHGWAR
ncbi:chemokine-like protein TAFA-5 isoform X5 [Hemicordylus capensis]|uniref:chemokine-like protein TAFA-5 isoform X5 n=1 Tax=Hemicordylus capensis TaxID=884348 RepID=UPI002302C83E|nr:chemokine-like protein TAFA-5 isoform X5 [Hemicordylus capensis]